MKAGRFIAICCLAVMLTLSVSGYLGTAEASDYLGNLCFGYSCAGGFAGYLKMGYFWMGDEHYLVSGTFIQTVPTFAEGIYHGNAEIIGTDLHSTLINTSSGPASAANLVADFVTDLFTFTGTLKGNITIINSANVSASVYGYCVTSYIACP